MTEAEEICLQIMISFGKPVIYSMILPILVALFYWKEFNKSLKIFFAYVVATLVINLLELWYITELSKYVSEEWLELTCKSTNFFFIFHQLKNFAFLGWFYNVLLAAHGYGHWVKRLAAFLCMASVVFYIVEKGWCNYGAFGPTAEAIFMFALPFFYLWYLYRNDLSVPLTKNAYFWISLALAAPNLIGLFLFFTGETIQTDDFCLFTRIATVKNGFEIIGQVLLCIGFSRARFARFITSA